VILVIIITSATTVMAIILLLRSLCWIYQVWVLCFAYL